MNIQGLIERYEKFKASKKKLTSVDLVLKDLRSLDEPEPTTPEKNLKKLDSAKYSTVLYLKSWRWSDGTNT
nr:MAG TPA: hypothetical protein [Caudoviricetes sp.]